MNKIKPLSNEIEQTKAILISKMSDQKSSCKAFVAFFQEFEKIMKNTSEEMVALIKHSDENYGQKSLIQCREFENEYIKELIDESLGFLRKLSDQLEQLSNKIRTDIYEPINSVYSKIRAQKKEMLEILSDKIKKNRDSIFEKFGKRMSLLNNMQNNKKYSIEQINLQEMEVEKSQMELKQFNEIAQLELISMVEQVEQCEIKKNQIIIKSFKEFISLDNKFIDNSVLLLKNFNSKLEILPEPGTQFYKDQLNLLGKNQPQLQKSQSQQSQSSNSPQKEIKQKETVKITLQHIEKINLRRQQNSKHIIKDNIIPQVIMSQIGIFNEMMPNSLDISKEFNEQDFYYLLLLLMMEYGTIQSKKIQDSFEWQNFISHSKNRFGIKLNQFKKIENFFSKLYANIEESFISNQLLLQSYERAGANNSLMKKVIDTIKSPTALQILIDLDPLFNQQLLKQILLFEFLNEYWKQLIIPTSFDLALFVTKEVFEKSFNEAIELLVFNFDEKSLQNNKCLSRAADILMSLKDKGQTFDLSFPLNQVLVEMLLQILVDSKNVGFSENWEDYLEIIQQFSLDTLKITPSHLSVTLISQLYEKIIHPCFMQKDLQINEIFLKMDKVLSNLWLILIQESRELSSNSLTRSLRYKMCQNIFSELLGQFNYFWQKLPSDNQFLQAFYRLFLLTEIIMIEFTQFKTIKELNQYILKTTGNNFTQIIFKRENFNPLQEINNETIINICNILPTLIKDLDDLKNDYLILLSQNLQRIYSENIKEIIGEIFCNFVEGAIEEILVISEQIDICEGNNQIKEDQEGRTWEKEYYELSSFLFRTKIGTLAFQNVDNSNICQQFISQEKENEMLANCLQSEKYLDNSLKPQQQLQVKHTKTIADYCSILFKSIETIKDVFKLKEMTQLKQLLMKKMEVILFKGIEGYLNYINYEIEQRFNKSQAWFKQQQKSNQKQVPQKMESSTQAQQQIMTIVALCLRLGNINFLDQQLEKFKFEVLQNQMTLVQNIQNQFGQKLTEICKRIAYIICSEVIDQCFFDPLYANFNVQQFNTVNNQQFQAEYVNSGQNLIEEIIDFFIVFNQTIPSNLAPIFYDYYIEAFFQRFYFAILDMNKINKDIKQQKYSEFISLEANVIIKVFQNNIRYESATVKLAEQTLFVKELAIWFDSSNEELISIFDDFNLKGITLKCSALYKIFSLRKQSSNQRIKDYVKKYDKMYNN